MQYARGSAFRRALEDRLRKRGEEAPQDAQQALEKGRREAEAVAEGDLVALHTHQTWPGNEEYVTMDFFRFDSVGKIVEHWDAPVPKLGGVG